MTRVIIVGEIYNADLSVGGGPMPGGGWGGPVDPGWGGGWQRPDHIWGQRPPHVGGGPIFHPGHPDHGLPSQPGHPGNRPPGSWGGPVDPGWGSGGGEHPGNRPPGSGEYPTGGPIVPPQGGTDVPEDEYEPAPPPESITSQYIVSVWDPKTMTWTTKSYPPR